MWEEGFGGCALSAFFGLFFFVCVCGFGGGATPSGAQTLLLHNHSQGDHLCCQGLNPTNPVQRKHLLILLLLWPQYWGLIWVCSFLGVLLGWFVIFVVVCLLTANKSI